MIGIKEAILRDEDPRPRAMIIHHSNPVLIHANQQRTREAIEKLDFVMVNEVIWSKDGTGGRWGSYGEQRPIFGSYPYPPNFLFKNVHEYILIFAKPPQKKIRNAKALPYEQLFDCESSGNGHSSNGKKGGTRRSSK